MMIKLKEVQKMTSLSRSSIYAYIDKGIFPAQVKVGERSIAWNYDEITNWLKFPRKLSSHHAKQYGHQ